MLRQNQRALNKAMRDLDRERASLEQQEKKIIADIKMMAKKGQMVSCTRDSLKAFYMCFDDRTPSKLWQKIWSERDVTLKNLC